MMNNDYSFIAFMFVAIAVLKMFELFGAMTAQQALTTTDTKNQNVLGINTQGLKLIKSMAYVAVYGLIGFKFYGMSQKGVN